MGDRNTSIRTNSILPTFRGVYLERFLRLVESIDANDAKGQREAVSRELVWCNALTHDGHDRLKYRAILMVLRDVMGQGWRTQYRRHSIFLTRPDYTHGKHLGLDHALVKEQIRAALREERLAKIATTSTKRFIRGMESPSKGKLPILDLVTPGKELARDLRRLPKEPVPADLLKVIDPYLQLVRGNARDRASGQKLIDIWRYFRYLWAIPYQPTPGRNLFYLVRDAARPNHPVIGIAALGNCVVQMSERDQLIGWSVEAVEKNLERRHRVVTRDLPKESPVRKTTAVEYLETEREHRRRVQHYAATLWESIDSALSAELVLINLDGLATQKECKKPTEALVRRLLAAAGDSERERRGQLRDSHNKGESVKRTERESSVEEDTQSPLYVRKRAQALADILFARLVFQKEAFAEETAGALRRLLQSDDGRKALRIGLHSNKKAKIGSSMMDIIICGAIAPYSEMLGGKLVAMLMASPQVVREYREVYGDQPGQIASRLAGVPVVRPADLVFLTTTSLYHVGSSQYERLRIPGPRGREISFEHLGKTEGYGSTVLTTETTDFLRELTAKAEGMRRVNNIFGEGVSPKLRMTRDGLALIGIPQDLVLRHNCPRLIYGVRLAVNAYRYLRGEDSEPDYVLSPDRSEEGTAAVIRHWLTRWFAPRARREESLRKVEQFNREELRLSREVPGGAAEVGPNTEEQAHVRIG
jgi:hypothetical protein